MTPSKQQLPRLKQAQKPLRGRQKQHQQLLFCPDSSLKPSQQPETIDTKITLLRFINTWKQNPQEPQEKTKLELVCQGMKIESAISHNQDK
jgi:hypothetical protein